MNNKDMAEFAENLWKNYIEPKMESDRTGDLFCYRATVVSNNGDGTAIVKPACDNERTVNCTIEMSDVVPGSAVLVMRMGNGNAAENHLVVARTNALNPILNMGEGFMPTGIISISSNGVYDVTNYASANVDVDTGMYTADEIAERTISGALYGSSASVILNGAFAHYSAITAANFPECKEINEEGFRSCTALRDATFPNCETIRSSAFMDCHALENVSFPKCRAMYGGYVFMYNYSLKEVAFPECQIITNRYTFYDCSALTRVNFPACSRIEGDYTFGSCTALTTVNFPDCEFIGNSTFNNCTALTTVHFPACNTISSNAFISCIRLVSLYLTSVSSVTALGFGVFYRTPIGGYSNIAGRYGSVYVPASLYDQFIAATNWASISSRIVAV